MAAPPPTPAAAAPPRWWHGDGRFGGIEPVVAYKHYQDPVSERASQNRFIVQARERYLRRELADVLSWSPGGGGGGGGHVVVPDVAFARDYVEFLERDEVAMLLLGTVLDALRGGARSRREHARLRAAAARPTRQVGVFYNQHFVETSLPPRPDLSRDALAGASFASAAAWISKQSSLAGRRCVVVSDDPAVRAAAAAAGLVGEAVGSQEYFASHWADSAQVQTLVESIVLALEARSAAEQASAHGRQTRHRRWWKEDEVEAAVLAGTLVRGSLQVDEHRPEEAWVRVPNDSSRPDAVDIFLPTRAHRGRSIHGDVVAVEPLPREEWASPSFKLARRDATEEGQERKGAGDQSRGGGDIAAGLSPTGTVVGVMERTERSYVATLEDDVSQVADGTTVNVLAIPMDLRIPKLRMRTRKAAALANARLVCTVDDWAVDSTYPAAHVVRVLGPIGDVDVESEGILVECNLAGSHSQPYDTPSLRPFWQHLPRPIGGSGFAFEFTDADMKNRRDLRDHLIMSIDPPGCVDIDDALSLVSLPNGRVQLGVHIADVTHYVPEHSSLDREGFARSTTCYLVDRRLDMLPALLSTNLCSLRGGEDRCAVSVIWELEKRDEGWVAADTWFGRTLIKSAWEGSYQVAQAIIDGEKDGKHASEAQRVFGDELEAVRKMLRKMLEISMDFRMQRKARGALELHSSEVDFDLVRPAGSSNPADGKQKSQTVEPKAVMPHASLPVMDMVAEYMIYANSAVAQQIYKSFPTEAALRRHPLPRTERFDDLVATAALQGVVLDPSSNAALAASLADAERLADPHVATLLKTMATRAMSEAEYFCTGDFASPEEFYHYGLAADFYTHFTSPIRRYADIVVHRLLLKSLRPENEAGQLERSWSGAPSVTDQCRHMNQQHRMAKLASERSQELFFSLYFRMAVCTRAEAVVSVVRANGIRVYVPEFEVHGSVYLRSKEGHAFVPVGDNSSDAVADPGVTIELESNGQGGERKLRALRASGGDELYSIAVFDHVTVNIVAEQSKFHLSGVKISFVGLATSSGGHQHVAVRVPARGKNPSKSTIGALRAAIGEEQVAKEERLAEAQRAASTTLRRKAGLDDGPRGGRGRRGGSSSLYARLREVQRAPVATHTETEATPCHQELRRAATPPVSSAGAYDEGDREYDPPAGGRRAIGPVEVQQTVAPMRSLPQTERAGRARPPAATRRQEEIASASAPVKASNLARGPDGSRGFAMRRKAWSADDPAAQPRSAQPEPEPEPEPEREPEPEPAPAPALEPGSACSSESGSSADSDEGLEAFLDSVLD